MRRKLVLHGSMGSVENCITVIAKVSMKCSTKVNEIERNSDI
jgi:hypothetical protein